MSGRPPPRTKKEITRLVRLARSFPTYYHRPGKSEFTCPVHYEALRAAGERNVAHLFMVEVLPWEDATKVANVATALVRHLEDAELDGEPCDVLRGAWKR